MSHSELHSLESGRAHDGSVPAGRVAAAVAEVALALAIVGVWLATCLAG